MKYVKILAHGFVILAVMFVAGNGCTDNSGYKAELASLQAQAAYNSALSTQSAAYSSALSTESNTLAKASAYQTCMNSATDDAARTACKSISF